MADANWQKVREVFDAALQKPPEERQHYINEACLGNKSLLTEVESLFYSLDKSDAFLETPAVAHVADMLESSPKSVAAGTRFGHYEIIRKIGTGGMGEVYLAQDQKLRRQVAIKILNETFSKDETNLKRFVREARAASALNHPNILVIHEIGESEAVHYIVSEFIEGKTLREVLSQSRMSWNEALNVAIQIGSALSTAHGVHLVHRDIKPENVMLRPDRYVKVLDFGLAKLMQGRESADTARLSEGEFTIDRSSRLAVPPSGSTPGVIVGTVGYMSPEQAKGELVDERTDIFSFGVVLYEMLAGRAPFAGDSLSDTLAKVIDADPPPLSDSVTEVPGELIRIVEKTLRKNKDERYDSMNDVLADLEHLKANFTLQNNSERSLSIDPQKITASFPATTKQGTTRWAKTQHDFPLIIRKHTLVAALIMVALVAGVSAAGYYLSYRPGTASSVNGIKSVAVLPLRPIDTAKRDDLYEIGIADSLINKISSMKSIKVRRLSAIRKYAGIDQDPLVAGREQQVDYVLAGNYQLSDGKIRISAQLFNMASEQVEVTHSIVKDVRDVFAAQDQISAEIVNKLFARLGTSFESAAKHGTDNEDAYRKYLQGLYLYDKRTLADGQKVVEFLEQAIKLDPNYAMAWAGKAHAHRALGNFGGDTHDQYQKSIEAISHALALDADLADAHSALCENKLFYEWDFDGAEPECKRAIELDPSSARGHDIYARYLFARGRFDEAISEIKTAVDLEPTALFIQRNFGISLFYARRYAEAVTQFKRVSEIDPNFVATYAWLIPALNVQGDEAGAFEWFIKWQTVLKTDREAIQGYKAAYQKSGWQGVGRERVRRFDERKIRSYFLEACLTVHTGDKDKAFEYLEKSYQRREWGMSHLQVDPSLDGLRSDPRFEELVRRVAMR